jgi:hypothetical protein
MLQGKTLNPCGKGEWRNDDFKVYPKDPNAPWYSDCTPITVDDTCFDPQDFHDALDKCVKERAANPGGYCVGFKDCRTSAKACIQRALGASFKGPESSWGRCKSQSGWFPDPFLPPITPQ